MLRPMMLAALAVLSACATQIATVPFREIYREAWTASSEIIVAGVMDTSGVNFFSLFGSGARDGSDCVPLILNHLGQTRAKQLSGRRVLVQGRAIPMDELDQVIPGQYGEIDGREWSGTRCFGKTAIYVVRIGDIRP